MLQKFNIVHEESEFVWVVIFPFANVGSDPTLRAVGPVGETPPIARTLEEEVLP